MSRLIVFRTEQPRDAVVLTQRIMDEGLSVDRMPRSGHTIVKAAGEPHEDFKVARVTEGLAVEVESDETVTG